MKEDLITLRKFCEVDKATLQSWISNEVIGLARDLGKTINLDDAKYIAERLYDFMTDKYRNWDLGRIHAIFQKGICGSYGKIGSMSVSMLMTWITTEERLSRGENVNNDPPKDEVFKDFAYYKEIADKCMPFIIWCNDHSVDITSLDKWEYNRLRDKFNSHGESGVRYEIEQLPKYKGIGNLTEFMQI